MTEYPVPAEEDNEGKEKMKEYEIRRKQLTEKLDGRMRKKRKQEWRRRKAE